jgi:hypothetical protein
LASIDILLATYNGAHYLPEQLASLERQTNTDWRLIARDDGSSDGSLDLVRAWAARTGRALKVIADGRTGLGAKGNFAALLEVSDAPYFACCDQDDVWLPEKLSLMLERLAEVESRRGRETPLLAYSDLRVVDAELRELHPSFRAYAPLVLPRPGREVADIMTQNVVAGCASLGNAALRRIALPIAPEAIMHDWWLALTAAGLGELVNVPQATMLYRQHGGNLIGSVRWTFPIVLRRAVTEFGPLLQSVRPFIAGTQHQARAFHARLANRKDLGKCAILGEYGSLHQRSFVQRKKFAFKHALKPKRTLRNLAMLAFV